MGVATAAAVDPQTVLDSRLIERFEVHRDFTRIFLDAFVLVSRDRRVLKFNQMFCSITGLRAIDVRKAARIEDILDTHIQGEARNAFEVILEAPGPLRVDEVQATKRGNGDQMQLILGSYPYFDSDGSLLGACIILRDVTAETNLQGKYTEKAIQSVTDPLTSLYTRRYFEEFIDKELERARASHKDPSLGLLMFDLDKFKGINDTHGHDAGDFVLKEVCNLIKPVVRQEDTFARYGGEEFCILLPKLTLDEAFHFGEKIRRLIEQSTFDYEGTIIPVTLSIGVASVRDPSLTSPIDFIKAADACVYKSKNGGRNRVSRP